MEFPAPTARLAPFVTRFDAYSEHGTSFVRRREVPSPFATLVFNLGVELRVEHPLTARASYLAGGAFYTGVSGTYAVTETDGAQEGAQVMLTALGARLLLGFPLGEIGDQLVHPREFIGSAAARNLTESLQEANSHALRLARLEREVSQRIALSRHAPARDLVWALERLARPRARVSAVAAEIGCSRKHLSVRFRQEFGVTPRLFQRVARFDRAVQLMRLEGVMNWADFACRCGYADQAHMTRDFSEFAGSPPAALVRRRLPDEGGFVD
jgi:AraC-like DNA-binding protein